MSKASYGIVTNEGLPCLLSGSVTNNNRPDATIEVLRSNVSWLIRRGDLVLPGEKRQEELKFSRNLWEDDDRVFDFPIYCSADKDDYQSVDLPWRDDWAGKFKITC